MNRRVDPGDLLTVLRRTDLVDPVLIVQFDGWFDAGASAAAAMARIIEASDANLVASFDTEWLIDHRARRPTMRIVDGVNTGLEWPSIEISVGRDQIGNDLLLLHGGEPDHNWRAFVQAVTGYCSEQGVRRMVGLGAYPAAVPHTRPPRLSCTASSAELADGHYANASLDVPAGVESALEEAFATGGVPAIGLWAQVPHYVSTTPYPAASLALIEGLVEAADVHIDAGPLSERAVIARGRLDELVAGEESHREMVEHLERQLDDTAAAADEMPSTDELAAEVEQFLKDQEDGS